MNNIGTDENNTKNKENHQANENNTDGKQQPGILGRVFSSLSNSFFNRMETSTAEAQSNEKLSDKNKNNELEEYNNNVFGLPSNLNQLQPIIASTQVNTDTVLTNIPDTQNNLINLETNLLDMFINKNNSKNEHATGKNMTSSIINNNKNNNNNMEKAAQPGKKEGKKRSLTDNEDDSSDSET